MDPEISVIIPTRNRCDLLREAMASVRTQTFDRWELVVVDDASEDGTWTWLRGVNEPRLTAIRLDTHSEKGAARNIGLARARGRLALFLDDDDRLREHALEAHLTALEGHAEAIASVGGYRAFDGNGWSRTWLAARRRRVRNVWADLLFGWVVTFGQTLASTAALRAVGGWSEAYVKAVDHELWLRLSRVGPVVLIPEIVLDYRVHGGQWIPRDLSSLLTALRQHALAEVGATERRRGRAILRARSLAASATAAERDGCPWRALGLWLRAVGAAPRILHSPLTRPMVTGPVRSAWVTAWRGTPTPPGAGPRPGRSRPRVVDTDSRWPGGPVSGASETTARTRATR